MPFQAQSTAHRPTQGATGRGRKVRLLLALALLAGNARPAAAEPAPPPSSPNVITSAGDFWTVSEADKRKSHAVKMDLVVYYYDAAWHLLYGQTNVGTTYLPIQGRDLRLKPGQKVRLEGTMVPAEGFNGDLLKVTLLAEGQLPEPVSAAGRLDQVVELNCRPVIIEGYVLSQNEPDAAHVDCQLLSENHLVSLTLQISGDEPVPQLAGTRIRVRGLYDVASTAAGRALKITCWAAGRGSVEVLGWLADDARFKLPRTPIDRLDEAATDPWVRVVAAVRAQEVGATLTLRDDTGQIVVATQQPGVLPADTTVEIVGRPLKRDTGWTLMEPILRKTEAAGNPYRSGLFGPGEVPLRLRLAEQVLQLTPAQAEKRHPVTLRGVVTWSSERAPFFYLQDASGGVAIHREPGRGEAPVTGSSLEVSGATVRGSTVPQMEMTGMSFLGSVVLPPARKVSLEQALSGAEEGQRVEMRGFVRQVAHETAWTRLDLTAPTGEFTAFLPVDQSLADLRSAMVRIQGICATSPGENKDPAGVRLWVQNREAIMVDEAGSVDPLSRPVLRIAGLRQFSSVQVPNARARVTGMVLLHEPGRYFYLQDETGGIYVLTRESREMRPGDWVDVVGIPGWTGNRMVLREAVWRDAPPGPTIAAREVKAGDPLDASLDAHLVRVRASLRQVVRGERQYRFSLEAGGRAFEATLPRRADWPPPAPGSEVELTGVYVQGFDEYRRPDDFRLELRRGDDIALLAAPPWWDTRRILYVTSGLAACILLVFGWVMALRRRVQAQTEQIRRQLEKETRLQGELERTTRLESLGVLAGGIAHDFNNLLTAILGNLGLAAMDKRVMAAAGDCISEAERGARRARDITQQLLTFAKGGDPVRTAVLLPDVVSEAAGFARHGSNVRFEFDYPPDLPPADVDAGQVSRVVHNLVINAVQAMPDGGIVNIGLRAVTVAENELPPLRAGAYIRLTVADTGRGIPPENLVRIFDPYFSTKDKAGNSGLGLATVHSIVKKHHGHITAESQVGKGTTFRIWLPAAVANVPAGPAAPRADASAPARILVMDDEDAIRRVAGRMLSLAGHETTFASDGAEAIRAYHAARQAGRPFDVVIFDLTVPGGMGGVDALQELRKTDPEIRAVASSGYSSDPVMAHPAEYGFRSSLPKPYDIPDLIRAVGEARRP